MPLHGALSQIVAPVSLGLDVRSSRKEGNTAPPDNATSGPEGTLLEPPLQRRNSSPPQSTRLPENSASDPLPRPEAPLLVNDSSLFLPRRWVGSRMAFLLRRMQSESSDPLASVGHGGFSLATSSTRSSTYRFSRTTFAIAATGSASSAPVIPSTLPPMRTATITAAADIWIAFRITHG